MPGVNPPRRLIVTLGAGKNLPAWVADFALGLRVIDSPGNSPLASEATLGQRRRGHVGTRHFRCARKKRRDGPGPTGNAR